MKLGLFIPTYNAGNEFEKVLSEIDDSLNQLDFEVERLVIDSFSDDNTISIAKKHGFNIKRISRREFTHGEVRRRAAIFLKDCEYIVYMTQDVIVHKDAIKEILDFIEDHSRMVVAYGKQESDVLTTNILEQRTREFNYPKTSQIKTNKDIPKLGIKTVFSSDAFSIYRKELLVEIGSFPKNIKYCEDMFVAAKAIEYGYEVGYCANAVVTHSNKMNLRQQFKRYRSIGKFHRQNPWIQNEFGSNESEGIKLVISEWKFLFKKNKIYLIPYSFFMKIIKFIAYKF